MSSLDNATTAGVSTQVFTTALVLNSAVFGAEVLLFLVLRKRFSSIYEPRTYKVAPKQRVPVLPSSLFGWIPAILFADAAQIVAKNGLDAYCFVRFLYLMLEIFLPVTAVTWLILLPVDAARSGGQQSGVDAFTFGNVGLSQTNRYAAHLIVVYFLTFYIFYLLKREYAAFIVLRQDFLISKDHSRLAQSKTVLVTGIAKEYLSEESLRQFCDVLPGGVKRVWLARNLGDLPDVLDRRLAATDKLESGETAILKAATKAILESQKPKSKTHYETPTLEELEGNETLINRYVAQKDRPTHKLGFLGLIGKKVDTIDWAREEIRTTDAQLLEAQHLLHGSGSDGGVDKYPVESAAFIQFNSQISAHMFAQLLAHHAPLRMSARYLEVSSEDVIWGNLNINPYQAKIRFVISWAMTLGLIILWAFPVAFVGLLTNVNQLCIKVPALGFLCKLPAPVNGIIQGALPPIGLAVLFILLPIILRMFARFEGIPLNSAIEVSLMSRFFLFLVIHGFLIVTLAAGLVSAIPAISANPSSAVTLLATKLPAASTFFLTYFVTVGLSGAAGALLQIVPLIVYYVKLYLLSSTPRAVFGIRYNMPQVQWGTLFPNMTLLTVIGLVYSVIAPLVAGFALLAFGLFWFVYKYLFLWVYDVPTHSETGGRFYPIALSHIFIGLYIEQICLAGLFFLAKDANGKSCAIAQGAFMVILILITILFQNTLLSGYKPLIEYLPLSLAGRMSEIQAEPQEHTTFRDSPEMNGAEMTNDFSSNGRVSDDKTAHSAQEKGGRPVQRSMTLPGEEHIDIHAFDHPATYITQRTVWIPEDTHGLYKGEVTDSRAAGVDISTAGASLDAKGAVTVVRSPPGDDWDPTQVV